MIKAGIAGGAGYTAGELIRLLLRHPDVKMEFVLSSSQAGKPVSAIHTDLYGETDLQFTDQMSDDIDVLFLCVGHGDARKFLEENEIPMRIKLIDLSQDFRHQAADSMDERKFVYGLPERYSSEIMQAENVANPGCFATCMQLGLLPLSANGFHGTVFSTGITGSTGAGQSPSATSHFSWRANNIQAYKSLEHQHIKEVRETLSSAHPRQEASAIHFIPWRGDFARGIFISQQFETDMNLQQLYELFHDYYSPHPFVKVSRDAIHLKQVVNTNNCIIQIEKKNEIAVVHSALDNLLKGASGQALQNMNLLFGLTQTTGLKLKASAF